MRLCMWCGEKLERKPSETASNFAKRTTCDRSCAASLAEWRKRDERIRNPRAVKTCEACHCQFAQGPDEANREFDKKRACRGECAGALRSYSHRGRWPEWVLEERERVAWHKATLEHWLQERRERLAAQDEWRAVA